MATKIMVKESIAANHQFEGKFKIFSSPELDITIDFGLKIIQDDFYHATLPPIWSFECPKWLWATKVLRTSGKDVWYEK